MVTTHAAETLEEARVRLAAKARETGVQLRVDDQGRHWGSSTSQPGHWHALTGYSCDCPGFANRGRCRHHSALLEALGWLDDADPEPTPPVEAVAVVHVPGAYGPRGWLVCTRDLEWIEPTTVIAINDVDMVRVVGDSPDVRVHWLVGQNIVDNMTASMPSGLTHRGAVEHWVRALAASVDVDDLLYGAGLPEDTELWDDLVGANDADDVDELGEVA